MPVGSDQNVVGLQIAMNHAARVHVVKCLGKLNADAPHLVHRQRTAICQIRAQRLALDVVEHHETRTRFGETALQTWMIEACCDLDFAPVAAEGRQIASDGEVRQFEHDVAACLLSTAR